MEIWLKLIEEQMVETLKDTTKRSVLDTKRARTQWVREWPGQIILAVNMYRWTIGAEGAINA